MKFGMMTHIDPFQRVDRKILSLRKSKMAAAAILKITKIMISPERFDRFFYEIWFDDAK